MAKCDECGVETREVVPTFLRGPSIAWYNPWDADRVLPRLAIAALNPEAEAAIPWGAHPDDNGFGRVCRDCAEKIRLAVHAD